MKTPRIILAATLGFALIPASADVPGSSGAWTRAVNSGDTTAIAHLYTDNAVLVSPGTEIVSAPSAIGAFWAAKRVAGAGDFHLLTVSERVDGDRLYQSAVWTTSFQSNGAVSELEGQMTNVLVRQPDGGWKIQLQSWN